MDAAALDAEVALLSPGERARHDRFVFPRDRRDFAAAHALLRRCLSDYGDAPPASWQFETTTAGRPYLRQDGALGRLAFNLSHTPGLVACAFALDAEIGIDVEAIDRGVDGLDVAQRYFAASETAQLEQCAAAARPARFVELWTLKEACAKALGGGLSIPLDELVFELDAAGSIQFRAPARFTPEAWQFAQFTPDPRYRLAIALRRHLPRRIVVRTDAGARGLS